MYWIGFALAGQLLGGAVEGVGIAPSGGVEALHRHHHDLHKGGGGEGAQGAQFAAVVADQVDGFVAVERGEMALHHLEALDHAFVDGDARHDDDELAEAVVLAQFVDRAQVDVGLAGAGLHLDREARVAPVFVAGSFEDDAVIHSQVRNRLDAAALLHGQDVSKQPVLAQHLSLRQVGDGAVTEGEGRIMTRQTLENIHHRLDGVELEIEVVIELQFKFGFHQFHLTSDHVHVELILHAGFELVAQGAVEADKDVLFFHREELNRGWMDGFIEADKEIVGAEIRRAHAGTPGS